MRFQSTHRCFLSLAHVGYLIIISNVGLVIMAGILIYVGPSIVGRYYLVPYLVGVSILPPHSRS